LSQAAYYDSTFGQFVLRLSGDNPAPIAITNAFIQNVTDHIEQALSASYANFVFLPDMGHSHLNFPSDHWHEHYEDLDKSLEARPEFYQQMLNDPQLMVLYHLSERLQTLDSDLQVMDDPILSFRFWNRNFVGYNDAKRGLPYRDTR
jgi:hypothetical protein